MWLSRENGLWVREMDGGIVALAHAREIDHVSCTSIFILCGKHPYWIHLAPALAGNSIN
jgi:hypothetical protein